MKIAPLPKDEEERLERLREYNILDTAQEASFDSITRIISKSIGVPISLVSLVDEKRQWFKSHFGINVRETPRDMAICAHAIHSEDIMVVENTLEDERFFDNPLVTGPKNIRFYAGAPLITPDGFKIGTLCAIDRKPHKLNDDHKLLLRDLADIVIDEMELRKARQDVLKNNETLNKKISELMDTQARLEIQGKELVKLAEKEAQLKSALSQEIAIKDRFFSIIAHDLKSPFNALLGFSEFLAKRADKLTAKDIMEYASMINLSSKTLYELLENLLEWGRFQMEKGDMHSEHLNLPDIVKESMHVLKSLAANKNVSLSSQVPDLTVDADRNMILLVIRNLITNAIKFTPEGGAIEVKAERTGEMVEISISDTGVGIAPHIMVDSFAIDKKTTTLGTDGEIGTGLGLPLCKEMIELHKGHIRVESEQEKGTTFRFTLPEAA
ncbi:GAF domain-containing sensor histidine kinase [Sneathiella sp. HT1-7]|uniref:GAF domain-containing sensor histidine kinase n=1 Tax=Sneathiella sp. HT1-7 TaxID=2887192 RepID=UPI001D13799F|nr:GAF domain-containing sensor histidine kinase [Sneathiella sp. HT1-7]MCC3305499.1 GAF domain-containing sensor histidine kinase [Sneathiella sp. HT1-7]